MTPADLRPTWATPAVFFLIVTVRYFLVSGAFDLWCERRASHRRIESLARPPGQRRREILWSLSTCAIFAAAGTLLLWAYVEGRTAIYLDVDERGVPYLFASFALLMALHETYFYWTHRLLHLPGWYRRVHWTHHESGNPTAWASFCFHPIEAVIQAAALPLLAIYVPTHPAVLLAFVTVMTVLGAINHTGHELYPPGLARNAAGKWLISATHHYQHHRRNRANFGLYFTAWDRWLGTEEPGYPDLYDSVFVKAPGQAVESSPRWKRHEPSPG